jgi:hypothetical protein
MTAKRREKETRMGGKLKGNAIEKVYSKKRTKKKKGGDQPGE